MESLRKIPNGWTQASTPDKTQLLSLRIAVRQKRAADFEQKVIELSTPGHNLYGQHMSREEVRSFLKPVVNVSQEILNWLTNSGVPQSSVKYDGHWIHL